MSSRSINAILIKSFLGLYAQKLGEIKLNGTAPQTVYISISWRKLKRENNAIWPFDFKTA